MDDFKLEEEVGTAKVAISYKRDRVRPWRVVYTAGPGAEDFTADEEDFYNLSSVTSLLYRWANKYGPGTLAEPARRVGLRLAVRTGDLSELEGGLLLGLGLMPPWIVGKSVKDFKY